nr:helix-turn-helix domain-containing protein [Dyella sp. ASV24]
MDAAQLVSLAMKKTGHTTSRKLGEALGVSHVSVTQWINGTTCPTFEYAAELALMAGLPPVKTAAEVRMGSKDGARHKALLRRMASLAAMVTLTVMVMPSHADGGPSRIRTYNQGIMSSL